MELKPNIKIEMLVKSYFGYSRNISGKPVVGGIGYGFGYNINFYLGNGNENISRI